MSNDFRGAKMTSEALGRGERQHLQT